MAGYGLVIAWALLWGAAIAWIVPALVLILCSYFSRPVVIVLMGAAMIALFIATWIPLRLAVAKFDPTTKL